MKSKSITYFWIGFLVTGILVAFIYWLKQQKREVAPRPLIVTRRFEPNPEPELAQEEPDSPDPLDDIKGIGQATKRQLNEAGIYTFDQLAATKPEEIDAICGNTPWDPAEWIAEAERLAGME
jgi:predicted flap endonuclease-1-like 5' DNA nuclease